MCFVFNFSYSLTYDTITAATAAFPDWFLFGGATGAPLSILRENALQTCQQSLRSADGQFKYLNLKLLRSNSRRPI